MPHATHPKDVPFPKATCPLLECLEFEHLALVSPGQGREDQALLDGAKDRTERMQTLVHCLHQTRRSALCLSGGGIRSATFNLGVLQGLAREKVLGRFDYLSTVSGGGFVGGWLQAWMAREGEKKVLESLGSVPTPPWTGTSEGGPRPGPVKPTDPEPEPEARPLWWLRAFSNYLSPHVGLLDPDTWAVAGSLVRNLLLNWFVLVPLLAAALTLPHLYHLVVYRTLQPQTGQVFLVLACVTFAGAFAAALSISHHPGKQRPTWRFLLYLSLLQLLIGAILLTMAATTSNLEPALSLPTIALGTLLTVGLGTLLSLRAQLKDSRPRVILGLVLGALIASLVGGAALKGLLALAAMKVENQQGVPFSCLAVPYVLGIAFVVLSLLASIKSRFSRDAAMDREWQGRYGGLVLLLALAWLFAMGLGLWGPYAVTTAPRLYAFATTGVGASALSCWGAMTSKGRGQGKDGAFLTYGPALAALLVLAIILVGLAILLDWGILVAAGGSIQDAPGFLAKIVNLQSMALEGEGLKPFFLPAILAGGVLLGFLSSLLLPINAFSLHEFYRSRLVRAYLGASHLERKEDPFIGMDASDDLPLSGLLSARADASGGAQPHHPIKLFPVLNMALNLVHGDDLAWQERQAESFTATPFHAGSLYTGFRPTAQYGGGPEGLSLGTAMAISGAAANPNMGYHSSTLLTFLMTFFNLRLGVWMGNPGPKGDATWMRQDPRFPLRLLMDEALGWTTRDNPYVNLSDGGHFENLGLYQMVLRRCHVIVVCDASADPNYAMEDLGNTLRKIRIDLGIRIMFDRPLNTWPSTQDKDRGPGAHWSKGVIHYEDVDEKAPKGILYYLKPVLRGGEAADVLAYARAHDPFPQQPTSNQFFPESQFESYRQLGLDTAKNWLDAEKPILDMGPMGTRKASAKSVRKVSQLKPKHRRRIISTRTRQLTGV